MRVSHQSAQNFHEALNQYDQYIEGHSTNPNRILMGCTHVRVTPRTADSFIVPPPAYLSMSPPDRLTPASNPCWKFRPLHLPAAAAIPGTPIGSLDDDGDDDDGARYGKPNTGDRIHGPALVAEVERASADRPDTHGGDDVRDPRTFEWRRRRRRRGGDPDVKRTWSAPLNI